MQSPTNNTWKNPQVAGGDWTAPRPRAGVPPSHYFAPKNEEIEWNMSYHYAEGLRLSENPATGSAPQRSFNSKVTFLENLMSLNSSVYIQPSISLVHSIFKVLHVISLITWKLLLHSSLLCYLLSPSWNHSENKKKHELRAQSIWNNIVQLYLEKTVKLPTYFFIQGQESFKNSFNYDS